MTASSTVLSRGKPGCLSRAGPESENGQSDSHHLERANSESGMKEDEEPKDPGVCQARNWKAKHNTSTEAGTRKGMDRDT